MTTSMPSAPGAELHVVAAPTEAFFTRVALLAASIRRNAGGVAHAPIVVTLSRDVEPWDVADAMPWARELGITWRWVDAEIWDRFGMYGSALERLTVPIEAPYGVLLDADMLCTGPLDELPRLTGPDALGGVIAHVSPAATEPAWRDGVPRRGEDFWNDLHAGLELAPPPLLSQHSGWGINDFAAERRWCPPYYNLGLLAGSADVLTRLGSAVLDELDRIEQVVDTGYRCQLAVMTALARTDTASVDLPQCWNLANDEHVWDRYPTTARDTRLLHYMRTGAFERERDTASLRAVDAWVERRTLHPAHELLRRTLADARADLLALGADTAAIPPSVSRAA